MQRIGNLPQDPYILLSFINMKLRDEYSNLAILSEDLDVSLEDIKRALEAIGYGYDEKTNQFKSE